MANRSFVSERIYSGHAMPVHIDCVFTVASSDSAGLGITGLKGAYVQNIFMNTSASPGLGQAGPQTPAIQPRNPNPAAGTIVVQLQDSFNGLYMMSHVMTSPLGSDLKVDASDAALTKGVAYSITILGDATATDWLVLGVPAGVTPAVGVTFIALQTGTGLASVSRVAPSAAAGSGVFSIEMLKSASADLAPSASLQQGFGGQIILQCRKDSASDAPAIAAPADGTVIRLSFLLSNSSVQVGGN